MMYGSWEMECWWTEFFVILDHFLHFYPPNNLKNQTFEKNEKAAWRYYHFAPVYHKWQSYDVWFQRYGVMEFDGQNFLSLWTIFFCLFTLLTTQNIKILKNLKKTPGGIIILHKCAKNHDHMLYCCWDKDLIVIFHFGLGLALLPNSPINEN